MKTILNKSRELFDTWNNSSLKYIHWKGNDHIIEGLNGDSDLDVLLSSEDKARGCQLLKELGFVKFVSQYGSRYPKVEDWLGFDEETGRLLHLHLHYALVSGHPGLKEFILPWLEEALETRIQDSDTGLFIMNPNLELVTLYTRLILKSQHRWKKDAKKGKYVINEHFAKEIDYIKHKVDWRNVCEIIQRYYSTSSEEFYNIVKKDVISSSDYLKLHRIVQRVMGKYCRYPLFILGIKKLFFNIVLRVRNRLSRRDGNIFVTHKVADPNYGFSVAFIGQDGCGKSTVTKEIEKWLNWKIEAKRFYLGSGDHYNGLLKRLISKGSKFQRQGNAIESTGIQKEVIAEKQKKRGKNIKSFLTAIIVSMNLLMIARRAYKQVRLSEQYRLKGGIPLFDRFPQTQFDGIYDGPKIIEYYKRTGLDFWIVRIFAKKERLYLERIQMYHPSIVFKLILPPEESIRRKPFENIIDVSRKHEITKALVFPNSVVFEIDATQNYQQEILFIKRQIWQSISRL